MGMEAVAAPAVVLAWGANRFGQCCTGDDNTNVERKPRCVNLTISRALGTATPIAAVAAGESHTLVLTAYGDVFACGRGREGQLALGPEVRETRQLLLVEALRPWHVAHVACGSKHSLAISSTGRAFEWGLLLRTEVAAEKESWATLRGAYGKDFNEDLSPMQRRIVAGSWSNYLRNTTNSDDSSESHGEEGEDDVNTLSVMSEAECNRYPWHRPRICAGLAGASAQSVACGWAHTVIVTAGGAIFTAGYGEKGQLGKGSRFPCGRFEPVLLPGKRRVDFQGQGSSARALLACGLNHTAVVSAQDGELFTWGLGVFGQLGLGRDRKEKFIPGRVDIAAHVEQVACGDNHTLALTAEGELFVFGHKDAVGGQSHHQRLPEKKQELSRDSGEQVGRIYAGGTGSFVTMRTQKVDRFPSFDSWGYNQCYQLGRSIAVLELRKPGPVALPPLSGAKLRAFDAGSSHCVAVMDTPSCCVLPRDVEEPCFGNPLLLSALREEPPHDVVVITASGHTSERLGAHRSVLCARCPKLAARVRRVAWGAGSAELDLKGHTTRSVAALIEYLYTDYCRLGPDVASELRELAIELQLERLMAGVALASETESVADGMRWVRSSTGRWEQVQADDGDLLVGTSTYMSDLEALVVDGEKGNLSESDIVDFVKVIVRQNDCDEPQTLYVARVLLLAVDFFRALLEGGFSETAGFQLATPQVEIQADSARALSLCIRILASGNVQLVPQDPVEALAVLVEAHRLQLSDLVAAAEASLVFAMTESLCAEDIREAIGDVGDLFDIPRLRRRSACEEMGEVGASMPAGTTGGTMEVA